ncbi:MAG: hypothetical protein O2884_13840 [Chloroflexi bacterium]|nr:hypothetical protein [Chloroflexota bacterium]
MTPARRYGGRKLFRPLALLQSELRGGDQSPSGSAIQRPGSGRRGQDQLHTALRFTIHRIGGISTSQMATDMGVSRQTIERSIQTLDGDLGIRS